MRLIPQLAATLPEENRHYFHATVLDRCATRSVGRRYVRGVTHLDDALYLWLRTQYLGLRGHPLESQGEPAAANLSAVRAAMRKTMVLDIIKNIFKVTFTTVLLLITVVSCNHITTQQPSYGVKIQYVQGQPLSFPDIILEFVGKRESPPSDYYPRSMYYYDFKVYRDSQSQLISWSAGTGDIGPTVFELAGNRYALELAISDKLGILDENELVLWRLDD